MNHGSQSPKRRHLGVTNEDSASASFLPPGGTCEDERRSAMLLAYRLVKLIETHSDGLARSLHDRYRNDRKCSAYANVSDAELTSKVYEVYRHLGEWLLGKTEADIERRYLEIGAERAVQGVPASQVVWMICLVRENLWEYLQKHAELEKPAEIFGEMELLEMLDQFFNRAIYYATLGHERAANGDQVRSEPVSV